MGRIGKAKWCLLGCLIIMVMFAVSSAFVPDRLAGAVKWVASNDFAGKLRTLLRQEEVGRDNLVEMAVDSIGISNIDYQPVVILKEKDGGIYLPIGIGLLEANAISVVLEGTTVPRPLTPDLLCSVIDTMAASVDRIVVTDLRDYTFYTTVSLHYDSTRREIDARPSDAIAIALRVRAPIYATKAVLEKAGVRPDSEKGKYSAHAPIMGSTK